MRDLNLAKVDDRSAVPRYIQAKRILAEAISSGLFEPGEKLPNTSEIGARMNVSLITAHRAIQSLEDEGWVSRERGRGTFVRGDFEETVAARPKYRVALVANGTIGPSDKTYHEPFLIGVIKASQEAVVPGELVIQRFSRSCHLDTIEADGYICIRPRRECFAELSELSVRKPVVALGASLADSPLHCIDADHAASVRDAIDHLVSFGHERIALVVGPLDCTDCRDRLDGYRKTMTGHHIEVLEDHILVAETTSKLGSMTARLSEMMRASNRPTAVVACGYSLALDVLVLLRGLKLSVPEDVSLVGFGDPHSAIAIDPPLTTIRQPSYEMGIRAFERVVQLVNKERPTPRMDVLPTSLIVRQSTGPAN